MKATFTCLFLAFVFFLNFSFQNKLAPISACTIITALGNIDLTTPINGLTIDSVKNISYGKGRGISSDVLYRLDKCNNNTTTTCTDGYASMKYDVYFPNKMNNRIIDYTECGLPAIIMFHGGSFEECSDKENPGIKDVCLELALRGFIVYNVEYRRGVLIDTRRPAVPGYIWKNISVQQILAVYRASQDARGAVRSIIQRQKTGTNGGRFKIDENSLFLGGISAGSVMAMNTAYYERQGQIDSAWPGITAAMGDIDQDYYLGDTTINYIPAIKGVLDMWGAISMHKSFFKNPEKFFLGNMNIPPVIAFQGLSDNIFPYDKEKLYFSPDSVPSLKINFNIERNCLVHGRDFQVDDNIPRPDYDACTFGGQGIYNIFKNLHKPVELYLDCTMEHGMDDDCDACVFDSDFGTGYHTQNAVYAYIAARATTYFVAILYNKVNALHRSRFVECVNTRVKTDTADSSPCDYSVTDETNYSCSDYKPGL